MKGGKFSMAAAVCAAAVCLFTADAARAVIVPFTETFDTSSGWTSDGNAFYGTFYSFAGASEGDSPILFRATGSNSFSSTKSAVGSAAGAAKASGRSFCWRTCCSRSSPLEHS